MLSGNVTASVVEGRLSIHGDAAGNAIVLDHVGLGKNQVRITSGKSATTINGGAAAVVLGGVKALQVELGAGNDSLSAKGLGFGGGALINGGKGGNNLGLDRFAVGKGLVIRSGVNVTLRRVTVGGKTDVNVQPPAASVKINDSTFNGSVAITTGTGTDRVRIDADGSASGSPTVFKGDVSVSLGGGIDRLQVGVKGEAGNRATFQKGVLFHGGAQDDTLIYEESGSLSDGSVVSFEAINPKAVEGINLRTAADFAVLAGAGVSSTGPSILNGDLGTSPTATVTGAPTVNGQTHKANPTATQAKLDLTTAYNQAKGRAGTPTISLPGELSGLTLAPGVYKNTSSVKLSSGQVTLDAQGDPDAVFIFQMASTLTTISGTQIKLAGGAKASNVYWQVGSSATLGTNSVFKGTILADQSITLTKGATMEGRALARIGAVVLDSNTVSVPAA